jgi:hypothetical protein
LLKRKQIQYALKKLSFYRSSVDGLWGRGTSSALTDYAKSSGAGFNSTDELFASLLSKVSVPSSFAVVKKPSSSNLGNGQLVPLAGSRPKKDISFLELLGAFAVGVNAYNQDFYNQGSGVTNQSSGTQTCFAKGDYTSGFNKICNYDCLGSAYATTISSTSLCPLTVNR